MKSHVSPAVVVIVVIVVVAIAALVGWQVLGAKGKAAMKDSSGKGPGPGEFMKPGAGTGGAIGPGAGGPAAASGDQGKAALKSLAPTGGGG